MGLPLGVPERGQELLTSCGAACMQMVLAYYGKEIPQSKLIQELGTTRKGISHKKLVPAFRARGYISYARHNLTFNDISNSIEEGIPIIARCKARNGMNAKDFAHLLIIIGLTKEYVRVVDPANLERDLISREYFSKMWNVDCYGNPTRNYGIFVRKSTYL